MFLLIYLATCILWVITVRDLGKMQSSQKRIFLCVFLALPLIAVRLLYSLISDFGNNPKFSLIDGDITIQIVMATIEEFAVVFLYTVLGLMTPRSSIHPTVGGGIVPPVLYPMVNEVADERQQRNYDPTYKNMSDAEAGAQYAYNDSQRQQRQQRQQQRQQHHSR
jgi:hypothetical protein